MRLNFQTPNGNYRRESVSLMVSEVIIESEQELDLIMQAAQDYVNNNPECLLMKSVREPLDMYRFKEQNEALDKTKETYPNLF